MKTKMKAFVKHDGTINHSSVGALTEMPVPTLDDEYNVLVEVHYAGICQTDIGVLGGSVPCKRTPLVLGHEFVGRVVAVQNASRINVGDLVTANPIRWKADFSGFDMLGKDVDGCYAEYVRVPEEQLMRLPLSLDCAKGAMIEPIAAARAIVERIRDFFGGIQTNDFEYVKATTKVLMFGDNRFTRLIKSIAEKEGVVVEKLEHSDLYTLPDSYADVVVQTRANELKDYIRVLKPQGLLLLKNRTFTEESICMSDVVHKELVLDAVLYGDWNDAVRNAEEGVVEDDDLDVIRFSDSCELETAIFNASVLGKNGESKKKVIIKIKQ